LQLNSVAAKAERLQLIVRIQREKLESGGLEFASANVQLSKGCQAGQG
jgi:hypothetical protein